MGKRSTAPIRTIVAVAHDIGGAQAIYPVIAKLRSKSNLNVKVIAGHFAQKVFARFDPENTSRDWSEAEIDEYLDTNAPDLLLSSTSWKSCLEQGFRNRVRARKIPSVVVIDFWSNYRLRWHDATYRFEDAYDCVCVMDAQTAEAMNREGYPTERLFVTGQPHLERCYRRSTRHRQRSASKKEIAVLFLTISLVALGLKDDPVAPIRLVCQALAEWCAASKRQVSLTVRPHPHESLPPDFHHRISASAPPGVTVHVADRSKPILGQLKRSDLVIGYITMGLFEARSLGKTAIALKVTDHPPELIAAMTDAGIPLVPFDPNRIASSLSGPPLAGLQRTGKTHRGASATIAELCCDLLTRPNRGGIK